MWWNILSQLNEWEWCVIQWMTQANSEKHYVYSFIYLLFVSVTWNRVGAFWFSAAWQTMWCGVFYLRLHRCDFIYTSCSTTRGTGTSLHSLVEKQGFFLEWILQNKAGHLTMFTQCSINHASPDLEENRSPFVRQRTEKIEFHLGREHPFWGFSPDQHYLGLSTDLNGQLSGICCHG